MTSLRLFVGALAALLMYVLLNTGLRLLDEPSDFAVAVGYALLVTLALMVFEVGKYLYKSFTETK